jgi:hypothetical protein
MSWPEIVWTLLMALATVRAITTAWRKESESQVNGDLTEQEELILKEDMEHWWMAVAMNGILFSVGIAAILAPNPQQVPDPTKLDSFILYAFITFAVLLNVRIERHGWFYRKRNGINIWGRPTNGDT